MVIILFLTFVGLVLTFLFGLAILGFIDGFGYSADNEGVHGDGAWLDRK
jgi:hypothetical protein